MKSPSTPPTTSPALPPSIPPPYTHRFDLPPIILYQSRQDNLTANDKL